MRECNRKISIKKAYKLCFEQGLIANNPMIIDYEVANLFDNWTDINSNRF